MRSFSEGGGRNHGWMLVRKGRRRLAAPMYDVGCTTRTTAVSAYGQRVCAAPQGRVGNGVPTSQRTIWIIARQRRGLCEALAKGAGEIMDGCWFERSADFAELCHRLGKSYMGAARRHCFPAQRARTSQSYIVPRTSYIANASRLLGLFPPQRFRLFCVGRYFQQGKTIVVQTLQNLQIGLGADEVVIRAEEAGEVA